MVTKDLFEKMKVKGSNAGVFWYILWHFSKLSCRLLYSADIVVSKLVQGCKFQSCSCLICCFPSPKCLLVSCSLSTQKNYYIPFHYIKSKPIKKYKLIKTGYPATSKWKSTAILEMLQSLERRFNNLFQISFHILQANSVCSVMFFSGNRSPIQSLR